jgi:hypothetical protein
MAAVVRFVANLTLSSLSFPPSRLSRHLQSPERIYSRIFTKARSIVKPDAFVSHATVLFFWSVSVLAYIHEAWRGVSFKHTGYRLDILRLQSSPKVAGP